MSNWTVRALATREVVSQGLHDAIVEFDKQNMGVILAEAGLPFPEAKRRKAFEVDGIFIVAFTSDQHIVGYLEFCPDWECPEDDIYISSLQITLEHRKGVLLRRLISEGLKCLRKRQFRFLKTAVQKNNQPAIDMYRKLGFSFSDNPKSPKSLLLRADRTILETSFASRLSR